MTKSDKKKEAEDAHSSTTVSVRPPVTVGVSDPGKRHPVHVGHTGLVRAGFEFHPLVSGSDLATVLESFYPFDEFRILESLVLQYLVVYKLVDPEKRKQCFAGEWKSASWFGHCQQKYLTMVFTCATCNNGATQRGMAMDHILNTHGLPPEKEAWAKVKEQLKQQTEQTNAAGGRKRKKDDKDQSSNNSSSSSEHEDEEDEDKDSKRKKKENKKTQIKQKKKKKLKRTKNGNDSNSDSSGADSEADDADSDDDSKSSNNATPTKKTTTMNKKPRGRPKGSRAARSSRSDSDSSPDSTSSSEASPEPRRRLTISRKSELMPQEPSLQRFPSLIQECSQVIDVLNINKELHYFDGQNLPKAARGDNQAVVGKLRRMNFTTIRQKLQAGDYSTLQEFEKDMNSMVEYANQYYDRSNPAWRATLKLRSDMKERFKFLYEQERKLIDDANELADQVSYMEAASEKKANQESSKTPSPPSPPPPTAAAVGSTSSSTKPVSGEKVFEIELEGKVSIGRDRRCRIHITNDSAVSLHHGMFRGSEYKSHSGDVIWRLPFPINSDSIATRHTVEAGESIQVNAGDELRLGGHTTLYIICRRVGQLLVTNQISESARKERQKCMEPSAMRSVMKAAMPPAADGPTATATSSSRNKSTSSASSSTSTAAPKTTTSSTRTSRASDPLVQHPSTAAAATPSSTSKPSAASGQTDSSSNSVELKVVYGGVETRIGPGRTVSVGRHPLSTIHIVRDSLVSLHHGVITGNEYTPHDSLQGHINGRIFSKGETVRLKAGDQLQLGLTTLHIQAADGPTSKTTKSIKGGNEEKMEIVEEKQRKEPSSYTPPTITAPTSSTHRTTSSAVPPAAVSGPSTSAATSTSHLPLTTNSTSTGGSQSAAPSAKAAPVDASDSLGLKIVYGSEEKAIGPGCERIKIGRHHTADVYIKDSAVSRHHGEIIDGKFHNHYAHSAGHSKINGRVLAYSEVTPLKAGDQLELGHTVLYIQSGRPTTSMTAADASMSGERADKAINPTQEQTITSTTPPAPAASSMSTSGATSTEESEPTAKAAAAVTAAASRTNSTNAAPASVTLPSNLPSTTPLAPIAAAAAATHPSSQVTRSNVTEALTTVQDPSSNPWSGLPPEQVAAAAGDKSSIGLKIVYGSIEMKMGPNNVISIGRKPDAKLRINDASVSDEHGMIIGGEYCSLAPTGGSKLNGKVLTPGLGSRLKAGDQLQLGDVILRIQLGRPKPIIHDLTKAADEDETMMEEVEEEKKEEKQEPSIKPSTLPTTVDLTSSTTPPAVSTPVPSGALSTPDLSTREMRAAGGLKRSLRSSDEVSRADDSHLYDDDDDDDDSNADESDEPTKKKTKTHGHEMQRSGKENTTPAATLLLSGATDESGAISVEMDPADEKDSDQSRRTSASSLVSPGISKETTPESAESSTPPTFESAFAFVEKVKSSQSRVFKQFLSIMKEFETKTIDIQAVRNQMKTLFKDDRSLLLGFNQFLGPAHRIEVEAGAGGIKRSLDQVSRDSDLNHPLMDSSETDQPTKKKTKAGHEMREKVMDGKANTNTPTAPDTDESEPISMEIDPDENDSKQPTVSPTTKAVVESPDGKLANGSASTRPPLTTSAAAAASSSSRTLKPSSVPTATANAANQSQLHSTSFSLEHDPNLVKSKAPPLKRPAPETSKQPRSDLPGKGATTSTPTRTDVPLSDTIAQAYIEKVKLHFSSQPHIFSQFKEIIKNPSISTKSMISQVKVLFKNDRSLLSGFNQFLPPRDRFEVEAESPPPPTTSQAHSRPGGASTAAAAGAAVATPSTSRSSVIAPPPPRPRPSTAVSDREIFPIDYSVQANIDAGNEIQARVLASLQEQVQFYQSQHKKWIEHYEALHRQAEERVQEYKEEVVRYEAVVKAKDEQLKEKDEQIVDLLQQLEEEKRTSARSTSRPTETTNGRTHTAPIASSATSAATSTTTKSKPGRKPRGSATLGS